MGSSTSRIFLLVFAGTAGAQEFPAPSDTGNVLTGPQQVQGQVVMPGDTSMIPVPNVWVTLHRVGSDEAAPIDSVLADARGRYEFNFRRTGETQAIYFVSATFGGVAYFTPPLVHSTVRGSEAEIAVFDTTSSPVPISVRGHHIIVSSVNSGAQRTITEVYELANDSTVTQVARPGDGGAVWVALFPDNASNPEVSHGDIPAGGIEFRKGRALVRAPIAPGLKQFAFTYMLHATAFPLTLPVADSTEILEVLIEEEAGGVSGAGLKEVAPVSLEGRSFRRYLGNAVPANTVAVIDLPKDEGKRGLDPRFIGVITIVVAGAMMFTLARALRRR